MRNYVKVIIDEKIKLANLKSLIKIVILIPALVG